LRERLAILRRTAFTGRHSRGVNCANDSRITTPQTAVKPVLRRRSSGHPGWTAHPSAPASLLPVQLLLQEQVRSLSVDRVRAVEHFQLRLVPQAQEIVVPADFGV